MRAKNGQQYRIAETLTRRLLMKRQVKLRPSPAITDEQSDAEDVEEVKDMSHKDI